MKLRLNPLTLRAPAAGVLALLLGACGGGNEIFPPVVTPPPTVPASATASPQAYTAFASSLAPTEVGEPLLVGEFVAPTTETAEPLPVE